MSKSKNRYIDTPQCTLDIEGAIDIYLESLKSRNLRPSTVVMYERDIREFAASKEITDPEQITYDMIRSHIADLMEKVGASTVEKKRIVLCTWLRFLNLEGIAELPDISARIRKIKVDITPRVVCRMKSWRR